MLVTTRLVAITRAISPRIGECELTHLERQAIDVERARAQHAQYEACLAGLGCELLRLPAEPDLPDSVFVEDTAVVLDELAIITRPGATSRRPETESVARAMGPFRRLAFIQPPGTLDGGDLLCVGRVLYIGLSGRSNQAGVRQMRDLVEPFGYRVEGVPVAGCLHLKSAVTQVAEDTLLINREWVGGRIFPALELIDVDPGEPMGANALLVGSKVVYPAAYQRTRRRLEEAGIAVQTVDVSELAKAEGAVTCCSLIVSTLNGR
jgi:dimethylargininase